MIHLFIAHCVFKKNSNNNLITISCIYLVLTPNSRSVFRAGVSLNIHSFIHFNLPCVTIYITTIFHLLTIFFKEINRNEIRTIWITGVTYYIVSHVISDLRVHQNSTNVNDVVTSALSSKPL